MKKFLTVLVVLLLLVAIGEGAFIAKIIIRNPELDLGFPTYREIEQGDITVDFVKNSSSFTITVLANVDIASLSGRVYFQNFSGEAIAYTDFKFTNMKAGEVYDIKYDGPVEDVALIYSYDFQNVKSKVQKSSD